MMAENAGEKIELRNTLGEAASAYLRTAAHQPIAWQQWGEEAFDLAGRLDRPILLDIGAVWCHWCHVMDHESYENEQIAAMVNERFVAIKVDRDERPDVDGRYQRLVQSISQQGGGWPLTAFLTPEGHVFGGGTYFPLNDRYGRRGMTTLLPTMAEFYHARALKGQEELAGLNHDILHATGSRLNEGDISAEWLENSRRAMAYEYERTHAGFGMPSGPKFPSVSAVEFLLLHAVTTGDAESRRMALCTLDAMARGGVHDQIGGGYHRYSVDGEWHVPHFEKMLYDNAGMLMNHAHAFALTGEEHHQAVAKGIINFVEGVLGSERGGFGGSQDADVGPEDDGDYFTWTLDEVDAVLDDDEFEVAIRKWGIRQNGDMHHNRAKNVLRIEQKAAQIAEERPQTPEQVTALVESARAKLLAVRVKRETPFIDPTIYVNWNGLMIQGLVEAHRFTDDARALPLALRAAERLERDCWQAGRGWVHALSEDGVTSGCFLDDQAQMALALLGLHQVTSNEHLLDLANETIAVMNARFFDEEAKAFRDTPVDAASPVASLTVPSFSFLDQPTPAPNPSAVRALQCAALITKDDALSVRAEQTLRAFAGGDARQWGHMAGTVALAVASVVWPRPSVIIVGDVKSEATLAMRDAALGSYRPELIVRVCAPGDSAYPASDDGSPLAYVCAGNSCAPPVSDVDEMRKLIGTFGLPLK